MAVPDTACLGADIGPVSSLQVTNNGDADAETTFHVGWYLSSDPIFDPSDQLFIGGRDQVSSLAAGDSTDVSINTLKVPEPAAAGPQYVIAFVDEQEAYAEPDEVDNFRAIPIQLESCDGSCDGPFFDGPRDERADGIARLNSETVIVGSVRPAGVSCFDCWDGYVARVDSSGTRLWERRIDNCEWDSLEGVAVASSTVVTVGSYRSGSDVIPQVRGYSASGAKLWQTDFAAGPRDGTGLAIAADPSGSSVVITGSSGDTDVLLARYDLSGAPVWEVLPSTFSFFVGRSVAISADGSRIAVVGDSSSVTPPQRLVTAAEFSSTGELQWAVQIPSSGGSVTGKSVAFDNDGAVLVLSDEFTPGSASTRTPRLHRLSAKGAILSEIPIADPAFTRGLKPVTVHTDPAGLPLVVADAFTTVGDAVPYVARATAAGLRGGTADLSLAGTVLLTGDSVLSAAGGLSVLIQGFSSPVSVYHWALLP